MSRNRHSTARQCRALAAALTLVLGCTAESVAAQALTPAFTYQGELRSAGTPANSSFDMEFRLYGTPSGSGQIGPVVTRVAVPVTNGLFSVPLDFGSAQFAGDRQWLEIAIRPAGGGAYETLSPRTEVIAAPYAWGAAVALGNSVTTTSIVDGTIGATDINATKVQRRVTGSCAVGQYVRVVNQDGTVICGTDANAGGTVTSIATGAGLTGGPITANGTISAAPGGIGPPQINATQVQRRVSGTCAVGSHVRQVNEDGTVVCGTDATGSDWSLTGNAGTDPATNFIGTTDSQALEIRTRNARSLRIEPSIPAILVGPDALPITANMIGGSFANAVTVGVRGATIAGGGVPSGPVDPDLADENPNRVTDHYGTIGGGYANQAGDASGTTADRAFAVVGGGTRNTASGETSTVGGGNGNTASGFASTVSGGERNTTSGVWSTVSGGVSNTASGSDSAVSGGLGNTASGSDSTVSGGFDNCAGGDLSWAGGNRAKVRPGTAPASGACAGLPSYPGGTGDRGSFVWADSQAGTFVSTGQNQFLIRADGGMAINTNTPSVGSSLTVAGASTLTGALTVGGASTFNGNVSINPPASLSFGGTTRQMLNLFGPGFGLGIQDNTLCARTADSFAWHRGGTHSNTQFDPGAGGSLLMTLGSTAGTPTGTARAQSFVNVSDRAAKTAFAPVDVGRILSAVLQLPMASWAYRNQPTVRHLGPVAQDFHQAFGLGDGDRTISTIDADGVALAAIQGLNAKLEAERKALANRVEMLGRENAALRAESSQLRARLDAIEARLGGAE